MRLWTWGALLVLSAHVMAPSAVVGQGAESSVSPTIAAAASEAQGVDPAGDVRELGTTTLSAAPSFIDLRGLDLALTATDLVVRFTAAGDIPSELRGDYRTYAYYLVVDTDADRIADFRAGIGFDDGWQTLLFDEATGATTSFGDPTIEGNTLTASIPLSALGSPEGVHAFGQVQTQRTGSPVWVDRIPDDHKELLAIGQAESLPEPFPTASEVLASLLGASRRQEFTPVKLKSIERLTDRLWKEHGDTLATVSNLKRGDLTSLTRVMRTGKTRFTRDLDRFEQLLTRITASGGLMATMLETYSEVDDPALKTALVDIAAAARDYAVVGVADPSDWDWKYSLGHLREWTGAPPDVIPDLFAQVSADPGPDGTVSWGYGASDATVDVTTPAGGNVAIRGTNSSGKSQYVRLGETLSIVTAHEGSVDHPFRLDFRLQPAVTAAEGVTPEAVVVEYESAAVPDCVAMGGGVADPSPCVDVRDRLPDDGIRLVVLAEQGGKFNLARATRKDDCKDGGQGLLTDADGQPFRIQGDCIAYFKGQG